MKLTIEIDNKMKIRKAKLRTRNMFEDEDVEDKDYTLWRKIAEYMDGEIAFVVESVMDNGDYVFCWLVDEEKNKEVHYMMEQDSMMGMYIDDREGFDKAWDSETYVPDGFFYLKAENLIFDF